MSLLHRLLLLETRGRLRAPAALTRTPTLTVVIPCYNYGRYLRQCVSSVFDEQPNVDVDVIIVDDKSTDDSLAIASEIASGDERVFVIAHDVNKGHIATYNDGLMAARGEFVLLLSADDVITPGALSRAAALLVAEPTVGMVYGRAVPFQTGQNPQTRSGVKNWIIWSGQHWLLSRCKSGYNVVASPEVVMRTSLLRDFGGYRPDLPHAGDFEMWLRSSAVSDIGFLVGADQALYRQHGQNMNVTAFHSGTAKGQFIDLKQRWGSFEAVFEGVGARLPKIAEFKATAKRTLAVQAIRFANYAFARGFTDYPIAEAEALAVEIDPTVTSARASRQLRRRKRLGMLPIPLHPLWALSAIIWRAEEVLRRWRRKQIGI